MKLILSIWLVVLLTACQHSAISTADTQSLLRDELFQPVPTAVETPAQIFALPEQTKMEIHNFIGAAGSVRLKTDALLNYLFTKKGTNLLYQNDATLTAAETLAAQQANCLSLTILSYSLAEEAGLDAEFRDIRIPEYWTQSNGQSLLNGHVNLKILGGKSIGHNGNVNYSIFSYVIDFDIESNKSHFPSRALSKAQIVAMFYNNKAAEAMVYRHYDLAYTYLKAALAMDNKSAENWNNLAVLYRQKQQFELAEKAYVLAGQLAPEQLNSRANLALLYQAMGQTEKAKELSGYVALKRNQNPYYHIMLGHESLHKGQTETAISHYKKGLALDSSSSEAMFGLAKAHLALGHVPKAEYYLQAAARSAPNSRDKERYQHKLKLLTTAAVRH